MCNTAKCEPTVMFQSGEVDCWHLECPQASCARPVLRAGHCCPSCDGDEADFCAARAGALRERPVLANLSSDSSAGALAALNGTSFIPPTQTTTIHNHCSHMGRVWPPGALWHPDADSCVVCHCIVCSLSDFRVICTICIIV